MRLSSAVLAARLCARLDPVRPAADPRGRGWATCATSARAISARPTCCAPAARGSPPPPCCSTRPRARLAVLLARLASARPAAARHRRDRRAFSAISIRSGCGSRAARASRPCSASLARAALADAALVYAVVWLVAAGADPLFVGRRAWRRRSRAPVAAAVLGRFDLAIAVPRLRAAGPVEAPRQYRAAARRHRAASRHAAEADASARRPDRPAAADPLATSIGPVTYRQLLARFGCAQAALDAIPDLAARGGGRAPAARPNADGRARDRAGRRSSARAICSSARASIRRCSPRLEDAPPALIVKGDLALLDRTAVAMVGARNASAAACRFARAARAGSGRGGRRRSSRAWRAASTRAAHDGALDDRHDRGDRRRHRRRLPAGERGAAAGDRRARPADRRAAAGHRAARAPFPLPQPDHRRPARRARWWSRRRPNRAR